MTDENMGVSMNAKAFIKPLLHAAKYPHCSVNGVLLGWSTDTKDSSRGSPSHDSSSTDRIVDAIPLFHSSLTLAPMMEVALTQIDVYCKSNGLSICGYYQANENLDNNKPVGVAYRLADKIRETCGDAVLLMIDNRKMMTVGKDAYILHTCVDGKWKKNTVGVTTSTETLDIGSTLLKERTYRELVDFDNYLDDITADWLNTTIDEALE